MIIVRLFVIKSPHTNLEFSSNLSPLLVHWELLLFSLSHSIISHIKIDYMVFDSAVKVPAPPLLLLPHIIGETADMHSNSLTRTRVRDSTLHNHTSMPYPVFK